MGNKPGRYFGLCGKIIARTQAREHMFAKPTRPRHLLDRRPSLPAARVEVLTDESTAGAFRGVFTTLVGRLPGEPRGEDAGHEGTVRNFVVKEPAVTPAATGVATRMRDRPARATATLGLP